jgi:hypothetical protein
MNKAYEAPSVTELGSVQALTQGTTHGNNTDASIPAHTPANQIPGFVATHLTS